MSATPAPKKRRKSGRRSVTGCRTCRARHIKCDEAPDTCKNCTSTGRKCDGYDVSRLPIKKRSLLECPPGFPMRQGWVPTSAERRCFSYFQYHSIPSLAGFFDSPLWRQLALQMGCVDPAVYHAANALSALQEDSEATEMRLVGQDLRRPRHLFALEQATRSYTLLSRRSASQDPKHREVVLLCCLIFVLADLLLGRYNDALQHLRSGLQILWENRESKRQQHVALCIVEAFRFLDIQSSHFGPGRPFLFEEEDDLLGPFSDESFLCPLHRLEDARRRITRLLDISLPFLARCWLLSDPDIQNEYGNLCCRQHRILSLYYSFQHQFDAFDRQYGPGMSYKERRGAGLIRLQLLSQLTAVKTCLIKGRVPQGLTPEYMFLLSTHESFMEKFLDRPSFTLEFGIIPGLYTVATRCPDYSTRLKAIKALLSWPHYEGIINSNFAASVAIMSLKADLLTKNQSYDMLCVISRAEEELSQLVFDTMMSTSDFRNWTAVRSSRILEHCSKTKLGNYNKRNHAML